MKTAICIFLVVMLEVVSEEYKYVFEGIGKMWELFGPSDPLQFAGGPTTLSNVFHICQAPT